MEKHKFNIFPAMSAEEYNALKDDINKNGYNIEMPIIVYQNAILDGWHRYKACSELKTAYDEAEFEGSDSEAIEYVMRTNKRRNLTSSQWACIAVEAEDIVNKIKLDAAKNKLRKPDSVRELIPEQNYQDNRTSQKAAELFNTNEKYFRDAEKLKKEKPDEFDKVKSGEKTISEVKKDLRREDVKKNIDILKQKEGAPPTGLYDVIIIDPPWEMEKIERDVAPNQVGFDYPTMSIDEIIGLKLPAEKNCHVFMWITQKHHRHGFDIFDAWGVKFICEFIWHKNGGFQPFGLPQFNHEYIMYGRIGTPIFIDFKNFFTCFKADRTGHSKKPEIFYETIKRVTAGKRIDIFNRRPIDGFDVWGNEA